MTWVSTGDEQADPPHILQSHSANKPVLRGQLEPRLRALLDYAVALTVSPRDVQRSDVQRLQDAGLAPRDVIDANQVVAYFNYVNRVAEGLGVELEDSWPPRTWCRQPDRSR